MKLFQCGTCDKILEEKYVNNHPASKITWLDATEHEDRIKEIDQLQNDKEKKDEEESRKAKEHNKMIDELKNALRKLSSQELDEEMLRLSEEIQELKKQLKDLPDEETKKSKSAMAEYIGIDNSHSVGIDGDDATSELVTLQSQRHRKKKLIQAQTYSVLTLTDSNDSVNGDGLFIKQGSTD